MQKHNENNVVWLSPQGQTFDLLRLPEAEREHFRAVLSGEAPSVNAPGRPLDPQIGAGLPDHQRKWARELYAMGGLPPDPARAERANKLIERLRNAEKRRERKGASLSAERAERISTAEEAGDASENEDGLLAGFEERIEESVFLNKLAKGDPAAIKALAGKAVADQGAPFEPSTKHAIAALKKSDRAAFESLRAQLKKAGCRVAVLDSDLHATEINLGLEAVDDELAGIFAAEHAADLRYVAAWGRWHQWRQGCWREDTTLHVFDLIRKTAKAHNAVKLHSMAKMVAAVHALARADRRIAATTDQWDADPWALNTPDGIVDLKTGKLKPHDPNAYCSKIAAVGPRGDCPRWLAFLRRVADEDEALIAFLRRVAGYCLTGDTSEQAFFFGYGVGQNGKGVFVRTLGYVLGDYCKASAIETFTESKSDRHPTEIARLIGARLVTATETEEGRHWAESRIKELTGGDAVTAHFMRQDDFTYIPRFKLFFTGNHKPGLRNVGKAMRRRLNMIPFAVVIPDEERDPRLEDKLKDEAPGILQWAIDGCLDWQERGLAAPEALAEATSAYFVAQDSFTLWLEESCVLDANALTATTALFASWKAWAERAGVRYGDVKTFGEAMETAGFVWKRTKFLRGYAGLRLAIDPPQHWQDDRG